MTERFYITTPIYYINAAPHVGTAYSTIVADTLARYHRLRGHDTRFLTGTDEHGQKIERAAAALGESPQVYADRVSALFRDAWPKLDIFPDDFIRTTEPRHEARVQELWSRIRDRGDIYLGDYEGWYCVADEAFYTEKELVDGKSPTGRPVERVREPSYFFRLSKYTDVLLDFYERHPTFIAPEGRFNEVKNFVKTGLFDLSVSRTTFNWGVQVPGDPKHVMYVWFDALSNYWSALGDDQSDLQRFWPANVHLVGKEITRFHAVYWPAFLLAAGFTEEQLPKQVYAHGWLTVNGEKMSKSAGNFLDPAPIVEAVGADTLRYYLLRAVSLGLDGDFSHKDMLARRRSELGNDLGNLLHRTLGLCKEGKTTAFGEPTDLEKGLAEAALLAATKAKEAFDDVAPHRALEHIWALCRHANTYVDRAAPWVATKQGDTARVGTICAALLEALRFLSILVSPVIPTKANELRAQLGLDPLAPTVGTELWPTVFQPRPAGELLKPGAPLFPTFDPDQEKAILDKLVPASAAPAVAAAPPKKAEKTPEPAPEWLPPVDYDTFAKTDLRVGIVTAATKVPKKDKLLDLRVDIGEAEPRRIVAGLALSFTPEALIGKHVVVVANLAPRDFGKGLVSHGMLLAAGPSDALALVNPGDQAPPGTKVK